MVWSVGCTGQMAGRMCLTPRPGQENSWGCSREMSVLNIRESPCGQSTVLDLTAGLTLGAGFSDSGKVKVREHPGGHPADQFQGLPSVGSAAPKSPGIPKPQPRILTLQMGGVPGTCISETLRGFQAATQPLPRPEWETCPSTADVGLGPSLL